MIGGSFSLDQFGPLTGPTGHAMNPVVEGLEKGLEVQLLCSKNASKEVMNGMNSWFGPGTFAL